MVSQIEEVFSENVNPDYKRIEVGGTYEALSPKSVYGDWKTGWIAFYHRPKPDLTYFIGDNLFWRKEGQANLWYGGAYKDWTPWLYTYTSLSVGTKSTYLPKFRIDQEFNFKLGEKKNFVLSTGFSHIKYHDVHKDLLFSLGFTFYQEWWNFTYKHFINKSDPGNLYSSSELLSLGIGKEKKFWTYFDISFGKQAYLATYLSSPEEVKQNSFYSSLRHRQWLKENFGLIGEISYFKLKQGYEKYGFGFGFFKEF